MQALSVLPLKGDCLGVPHLEFEVSSSVFSRINRRKIKKWDISGPFNCKRSSCLLFVSSKLREFSGGVCHRSPKKSSFGASFALASALEQETIRNELNKGDLKSRDGFVKKVCIDVKDTETVVGEEEIVKSHNGSGLSAKKSKKVDVRALTFSLRFATTADDVEEVLKNMEDLPLPVYSSMIRGFGLDKRLESASNGSC
ncbi:hypothetical protein GIB67_031517 [Kingdonia uniflora]|uniref:Uncharacterized protein n=1 Tax=Kingdonia uniflora TaxID=39325 RepID=A0A7J7MND6_9MAGN|nr:hypothetical protein GIB67_031517 [Kingdonia uniflora]